MAETVETSRAPQTVSDATLRSFVGYHMKRAMAVLQGDLNKVLKPLGLRMVTYSALITVVDNPGLRQSQLADVLAVERPNLVVILDELESGGLITRDKVPSDRRAWALMPTPKGQRTAWAASQAVREDEARLLRGLSEDERARVIAVMNLIETGRGGDET